MSKRKRSKNHGCLYGIFIQPFVLLFTLYKWIFIALFWVCVVMGAVCLVIWAGILLAPFFLIALLLMFIFRRKTYKLSAHGRNFDCMSGKEFERFCCLLLKKNGYTGVTLTKSSGDQGIDIVAKRSGVKIGIQCKCYSSNVGNSAIQQAYAGMQHYGCQKAVVLTNRYFTNSAKELAQSTGVLLWDRDSLLSLASLARM